MEVSDVSLIPILIMETFPTLIITFCRDVKLEKVIIPATLIRKMQNVNLSKYQSLSLYIYIRKYCLKKVERCMRKKKEGMKTRTKILRIVLNGLRSFA